MRVVKTVVLKNWDNDTVKNNNTQAHVTPSSNK